MNGLPFLVETFAIAGFLMNPLAGLGLQSPGQ